MKITVFWQRQIFGISPDGYSVLLIQCVISFPQITSQNLLESSRVGLKRASGEWSRPEQVRLKRARGEWSRRAPLAISQIPYRQKSGKTPFFSDSG